MKTPTSVTVGAVSFEHHRDAIGIGEARPRLSWSVVAPSGWAQTGYEIEMTDHATGEVVRSGRVSTAESVLRPWVGEALTSRDRRSVRVRVWGTGGRPSSWSVPAHVETGLMLPAEWSATWIAPVERESLTPRPAYLLRGRCVVQSGVRSARLYASARGMYELEVNGARVGGEQLSPGWTSYQDRLRYQTYDVTGLLRAGPNVVGAWLADGWYRGRIGFEGGVTDLYGNRTSLLVQLEIDYDSGERVTFTSDGTWQSAPSPITSTGLYEGETYDARLEDPGWSTPQAAGSDGLEWVPAVDVGSPASVLVAPTGPPVRAVELVHPVRRDYFSACTLLDFGQNMSGRLRLRVAGEAGQVVTLRHAEVLDGDAIATGPLRTADATDRYILRGDGTEEWEPRFTTHGFRYAEVSGLLDDQLVDVVAVVLQTDMARAGWFSCSDPLLDRLHENVVWSMRGNFVDVPTDCPQRDERLGWTGDIAVFAPTAAFLYDCTGMLASWLADVAAEQQRFGTVPYYVPWIPQTAFPFGPAAVWGDAAVLVPWTLYWRTGDIGLLRTQYASMCAWVDQVTDLAGESGLWDTGFQFGDWLDPAAPPDQPDLSVTDRYLVSSAYRIISLDRLAEIALVLGEERDHQRFQAAAAHARDAFIARYVEASGKMVSDTQTAYALALRADLLSDEQREFAGTRLAELVQANDHRIGTGFVGTPMICDALADAGEIDTAYRLLMQTNCPSWLYPVTMGATTIWERWDSMLPDGSINPGQMTSFNHYALGAVADWLHRTVAGLAPAAPGYRVIAVKPRPGGGLTSAAARHLTPYGEAEVSWQREGTTLTVSVLVPPGCTAEVDLVDEPLQTVGSGRHAFVTVCRAPADDPRGVNAS